MNLLDLDIAFVFINFSKNDIEDAAFGRVAGYCRLYPESIPSPDQRN